MTEREQEILNFIRENPMISQQDLAEKMGISRSSIGVHISNLMKKGYISGKGYVVTTEPYVVIVGGLTKDIGGKPFNQLRKGDSNPGEIKTNLGGVGRNIAHNLSLLGIKPKLLTALGNDDFGKMALKECEDQGIDLNHAIIVPGLSTAIYLYIGDHHGDMEVAIADMEIFDFITKDYLRENLSLILKAKALIVDANIPEGTIEWLANNYDGPIFADPVSTAKGVKFKNYLSRIHTLKPNKMEAELLSEVEITDGESLRRAADVLLGKGVKRVFISLGEDGVFAADLKEKIHLPTLKANLANATGGGDAFMAALVMAYLEGYSLRESGILGLSMAALAVESHNTINENITLEKVLAKGNIN